MTDSQWDTRSRGAIFLVGPGGSGKSTVGPLVAGLIGMKFVDLDARFCAEVGLVSAYVEEHGYRAYCESNAALAESIIDTSPREIVMATSSGFLAHDGCDDIVERNIELIHRTGTSVYLQPSEDLDTAARTLAFRQVRRYPDRDLVAEFTIAHARCGRYLSACDLVVRADVAPHEVANRISIELLVGRAELTGVRQRRLAEAR